MGLIRRSLYMAAAALAAAAAQVEPTLLRDVSVDLGTHRLAIGAVRASLWSAAWAQGTETVTLEDVAITLGTDTYRARRVDFTGVTTGRAELAALFDKGSTEPLAARLARLSATRISVPELVVEQTLGPVHQRTTHRNLVVEDMRQGRAGRLTVEASSTESTGAKGKSVVTQERLVLDGLNAAEFARLFTEKRGAQTPPATKIYDAFSMENVTLSDDEGLSVRVAHISGRDFSARATEESWSGTLSLIGAMAELDQPSPQDSTRLLAAMADFLGAFEVGQMELAGITAKGPKGQEDAKFSLARAIYTGAASGRPAELRLEGSESVVADGRAKIASVTVTGFSFDSTLQGLNALKTKPLDDMSAADFRKLIPTIGTIRWSGLDFDVPDPGAKEPKAENIRFTIGELEFTAEKLLNGIPTYLRGGVQNFVMLLPPASKDEGVKALLTMGYKSLDITTQLEVAWNESAREIVVSDAYSGAGMGALNLRATLGNATKDLFDPDTAVATVAAIGVTARSFDVSLSDGGLFERFLAQEARKAKKSVESVRREYAAAATAAVPAILGNSPQAKSIAQAVGRFIAKPGRLNITAKAKDAAGLGVSEILTNTAPNAILEKLEVTATAEERP